MCYINNLPYLALPWASMGPAGAYLHGPNVRVKTWHPNYTNKGFLEHGRGELMDRSWRFWYFYLVYLNHVVEELQIYSVFMVLLQFIFILNCNNTNLNFNLM